MTVTPEGLTITGPEDIFTHGEVYAFLKGRRRGGVYPEVAKVTTVILTYDEDVRTSTRAGWSSTHGVDITIYLSLRASSAFRYLPWSQALHEWGHAVGEFHYYMTHERSWGVYLRHRGVEWNPRLGTTYPWMVREMMADDYMVCFGNRHLERKVHMNVELPVVEKAAGRRWFNGAWRGL